MAERRLYLPLVQVFTVLLLPYLSQSSAQNVGSPYYQLYSVMPPAQQPKQYTPPQSSIGTQVPTFLSLKPRGVKITVPGPYSSTSSNYLLRFHVSINHDLGGVKRGDWNGEVTVPRDGLWSYTFPEMIVAPGDNIYYWVVVRGSQGSKYWFKEYKGVYQVPQTHQPRPKPGGSSIEPLGVFSGPDHEETDDHDHFTHEEGDQEGGSQNCRLSTTTYNNGQRPCVGHVFDTNFVYNSIDQIAGEDPIEKFTVFSKDNVARDSSGESIWPTLLEEKYGPNFVDSSLTMPECTSKNPQYCSATAQGYFILPPAICGRETTEQSFSFRYGTLEVTARLPAGDWIVPELWLMPKERMYGNSSGRIIIALSRGNLHLNDGKTDWCSRVLVSGIQMGEKERLFRKVRSKPWANEYHKFKVIWTPDIMQFFVDDQEMGKVQPSDYGLEPSLGGSKMAPFDQEFYLVFGMHVGGDKEFPDSLGAKKPWKNAEPKDKLKFWQARHKWRPSWTEKSALQISSIKLTAMDT